MKVRLETSIKASAVFCAVSEGDRGYFRGLE